MTSNHMKILSYYEDFKVHKGVLCGKDGFFDFQPPSSLHSDITAFAYGIREKKRCLNIQNNPCESRIEIQKEDISRRFYMKITAQLFDWEKHICGIRISANGKVFYQNDREFFETVNLGWPTIYIPIPAETIIEGENLFEISQTSGQTALLTAIADLVSLPAPENGSQLTLKTSVRTNDTFTLSFYAPESEVRVAEATGCEVKDILKSPINPDHTLVKITAICTSPALTLSIGDKSIEAVMPEIYPESSDFCLVGTDSDDHRHDDSDETDKILEIFTNTNLGNFWQARPNKPRNCFDLSSEDTWKKRIDYLMNFDTSMSLSDSKNVMPYFPEMSKDKFVGKHFHEAYLFFCPALMYDEAHSKLVHLDVDALTRSSSFGETKKLFCTALREMYESCKSSFGLTSIGSPSLLTIYEASSGFERVTIEPVSNINLLIGAVRGASPKMWGAHVPTDWYFGEPNDHTKANKFKLAMQLLYMHGANYIYAENSLFKTNAFSREDWEDNFCAQCRSHQRNFYDYTIRNPREGIMKADLAVLYGNNEYFMWHYDNRMAELPENNDWDITLWGKWKDNRHHKCWKAIDAWLPPASNQHSNKNVINLDLFSGTPYGSIDIIPYDSDYSKYKALILLGWNTYESGFGKKLRTYVENGGTAFVSYCHFNQTDVSGEDMVYASTSDLDIHCTDITTSIGKVVLNNSSNVTIDEKISIVNCTTDGEKIAVDENGNVLIWKKAIGKGTLYFGAFADFNCPCGKLDILKHTLRLIGRETAEVICSNNNICFTRRVNESGEQTIDLLNVCPNSTSPEKFELELSNGQKISGEATPCRIAKIII